MLAFTKIRNGKVWSVLPSLSCDYIIKDFVKMEDAEAEADYMKCTFCDEEIQGSGYKIANDVIIRGVKPGNRRSVATIKDTGDVCSRTCQIASKIAYLVHIKSFKLSGETYGQALEYCNCAEEEFIKGMDKYIEIMNRKIFMVE